MKSPIASLLFVTVIFSLASSCDKNRDEEEFDIKEFHYINTTSAPVTIKATLVNPDSVFLRVTLQPGETYIDEAAGWGGLAIPFQDPITAPGTFGTVQFESEIYGCWEYPRGTLYRGYVGGVGPWNGLNYLEFDSTRADEDQPKIWTYPIDSMRLVQGEPCQ